MLTSIVALGFAMPVMADEPVEVNSFPDPQAESPAQMLQNRVYLGAAVSTNMLGVNGESGNDTIYANAQYKYIDFTLNPGQYLPAASETVTACNVDGKYCSGSSTPVNYNATSAQGLSNCEGRFVHSEAGASSAFQCYDSCGYTEKQSLENLAHADEITGNIYYGGNNTCEPTSCVAGWHIVEHKSSNANLQNIIGDDLGEDSAYIGGNGAIVDYSSGERPYSLPCDPSEDSGCHPQDASYLQALDAKQREYYGFAAGDSGRWAVHYDIPSSTDIMLNGRSYFTDDKCYCSLTSYRETGHWYNLTSAWKEAVDVISIANNYDCAKRCAAFMRETDTNKLAFRSELLATATVYEAAYCTANTITIHWNGTTSTEITANQAGSTRYGGDIRTPRSATHVPGKEFLGWTFSKSEPTE